MEASLAGQDYRAHLDEQLAFLRASAASFDDGFEAEAKRLATQIRILVHDAPGGRRNRSVSLLSHLGMRDRLPWLDTAILPDPSWVDFSCGLCRLSGDGEGPSLVMRYAAPLADLGPDRRHPPAAFLDWWNEPVLADRLGHDFSRADFISRVANQDGGTHVDAELEESYRALTRENSMQIVSGQGMLGFHVGPTLAGEADPPGSSIALASVRQIAYEVLQSVEGGIQFDAAGEVTIGSPICPLPIDSVIEVGRNDPCPCGGGLKLKNCFGRRFPRRPRVTRSAAIAMA
jgi:hypothetical protein